MALRDCQGKVISNEDLGGLAPRAAYWDADPQRELLRRLEDLEVPRADAARRGSKGPSWPWPTCWATGARRSSPAWPGELRIYTTTIPAADRRVCLMQDPIYRMDVVCAAMGYYQVPMLSYDVATHK